VNSFYAECIGGMCVTEPSAIHEQQCLAAICLKEQRRGDAILLYVNATDFFIMSCLVAQLLIVYCAMFFVE